jgi:hypothetical protein
LGQFTGGGSVVQAHKATVDSASSIGLGWNIDGNLLDDGLALLADDANPVNVLGDKLNRGFGLFGLQLSGFQPLRGNGSIPLSLYTL